VHTFPSFVVIHIESWKIQDQEGQHREKHDDG